MAYAVFPVPPCFSFFSSHRNPYHFHAQITEIVKSSGPKHLKIFEIKLLDSGPNIDLKNHCGRVREKEVSHSQLDAYKITEGLGSGRGLTSKHHDKTGRPWNSYLCPRQGPGTRMVLFCCWLPGPTGPAVICASGAPLGQLALEESITC